jgi:hypothetical protein
VEAGRRSTRRVAALALGLFGWGACGAPPPASTAPRVGKVLAAMFEAAAGEMAPWRCAALDTPAVPAEVLATGNHRWKLEEHSLSRVGSDDELVIGVLADAAGSSPRTIAALGRLRARLDAASPDLVISLGGMGRTAAELEATLGALADRAPWPVIALAGDLEAMSEHARAVAALRQRGAAVVDARVVRWIAMPGATLGTIPGAGARERLVAAGDGCGWRPDDVVGLYAALTEKSGLRIVASAEAPRQIVDGEPAGELALSPPSPVDIVLHGPLRAAPSRAASGGRDGGKLALSPGTADATTRLPAGHVPSAGILVIRGGAWSWRPLLDTKR